MNCRLFSVRLLLAITLLFVASSQPVNADDKPLDILPTDIIIKRPLKNSGLYDLPHFRSPIYSYGYRGRTSYSSTEYYLPRFHRPSKWIRNAPDYNLDFPALAIEKGGGFSIGNGAGVMFIEDEAGNLQRLDNKKGLLILPRPQNNQPAPQKPNPVNP